MEKRMEELIAKCNSGFADASELKRMEDAIEKGEVELTQLTDFNQFSWQAAKLEVPAPSLEMSNRFYTMLAEEKRKNQKFSFALPSLDFLLPRLALMAVLLVIGFSAGYLIHQPNQSESVVELTNQVSELKEMMMLSLLEKESATERLKAVSLTNDMDQVSQKVTAALLQTLNSDENVNVRLAALEALKPYVQDSRVREGLVKSIAQQESPLVQMSLAELMAAIQEKKSVSELKKLLDSERVPKEVKKKINESIDVLI
jgi:DNA polymerase III delta prime subunit